MAEKFTYITLDEELAVLTKEDLREQLEYLGIRKGMTLLVHADMKRIGHIVGQEQALIEALMDTVGYEGTIVMPTFTPYLADPACQKHRVQRRYWTKERNGAYAFDRKLHMPTAKNTLAIQFLRNEGVARSYHPLYSFAAWGKYARLICDKHPLHFGLNADSPLGKLFDFNGYIVLLGSGYKACTMFQLARYRSQRFPVRITSAPIQNGTQTEWKKMLDIPHSAYGAEEIGAMLEEKKVVRTAFIGMGSCRFFSCREAVNVASLYFNSEKTR